jgi:hypothetical protein
MWNWILSWIYHDDNDGEFYESFMCNNWSPSFPIAQQELFLSNSLTELKKYFELLSNDCKTLDLNSVGYIGTRNKQLIEEIVHHFPKLEFLNLECIFNRRNKAIDKFRLTDTDLHILSFIPLQAINICGSIAVTDNGIRHLKTLKGIRLDNRSNINGTFIDGLPYLKYIHDTSGRANFTKSKTFLETCKKRGIKIISGNTV